MDVDSECLESSTISFEWTLRGLKNLFDSTKGEKKSKVSKSVRFGGGRWQILFYANAGQTKDGTEGGFVSLYLSCEPTPEEKEAALADSGRWVREGVYRFSFELRNVGKTTLYNSKEAHNHSFTWKTANWGWAQFARRDSVYYQSNPVKAQDAFVIICQITSSPSSPPVSTIPRQPVPKALLDTVGSLLGDSRYSDVQFLIPRRGQGSKQGRTIWAAKRLLQRAEYFQTMFESHFAEGSVGNIDITPTTSAHDASVQSTPRLPMIMDEFEDSDDEDDEELISSPMMSDLDLSLHQRSEDHSVTLVDSNPADSDNQDGESSQHIVPSPAAEASYFPIMQEPLSIEPVSLKPKMTITIHDTAYSTYRAMLYYIYTDNVVFAPLSSSFLSPPSDLNANQIESLPSTPSDGSNQIIGLKRFTSASSQAHTRAEWIREWTKANPGRPAPCSAKSMYRAADRFDLWELKERAAAHIIKSLTVENIAYEVFSPFAAAFEPIRKAEVEFFLHHWQDIRSSEAMKSVWLQIRNGRHPGFEEVWPLIAQSLEFKPISPNTSMSNRGPESAEQRS